MSTSGTRRRRSAAVVSTALLGMSVALAGCGVGNQSSGGGGGAAEGGGQIRATWWGGDSENQALNAALDRFTEAGGVEVARETQAWDGYWDRLATQTAGRNAPDLIMQAGSQIPDYAGRGALLDLNEVDGLASDVVDEGLQDFGAVDGELYGVVAAANAMGLVTNDELLADAGVSLPDGPYDWTQLAEAAVAVSDQLGDGVWGIQDGGGDLILFILAVRDDGRQFYAEDGSLRATRDDLTSWLEYWQDLRDRGGAPPADVTAEGQGELPNAPLAQQRAAMGFGWTQDYVSYTRLVDDDLSLTLPPYNADHPSLWMNAASLWSISSTSENPDAAGQVINHFLTDSGAIEDLGVSLGMPPSQSAREQLDGTLSDEEQEAMDYMDEVAETSTPLNRLWPAGFAELRTRLSELNEAVAFGEMSIPEAVDAFFATAAEVE
ncbi:ABC transporter substrate-binding protein [Georgenia deserti]|uniref:ABC transporter substrate-binding protein n=1 Tax=Georgenia deserti TaxID=2093781 RepID=A0ABW4L4V2_9MICO